MSIRPMDIGALAFAGNNALRSGNARAARDIFQQVVTAGRANAAVWIGLAASHAALGEGDASLAAIDKALALEPANISALIMKGDHLNNTGAIQWATPFYRAATRIAASAGSLPPDTIADLRRAQSICEQHARQYEGHLRDALAKQGFDAAKDGRFAESLDLMFGRKSIYQQQPRHYYFPGLAPIQFFARDSFPWLDAVEAATDEIRAELIEIMKQDNAFVPYIESDAGSPPRDYQGLEDSLNWSAFYLWKDGKPVPENAARCPKTMAALLSAPLDRIPGSTPSILFSLLRPGAKIPPHNGFLNTRLICHLPLIVPGQCGFRVGNEIREWVEGRAWVFDDTIEHEAWNNSGQTRVILLFDIWRPELSKSERQLVATVLQAISALATDKKELKI